MATCSQRVSLEKAIRLTERHEAQINIVAYLKVLRDIRYTALLNSECQDQQSIIGELRLIQKLLSVLENGGDTLEGYIPLGSATENHPS